MTGRGETCSHLAAIVFLIEYGVKARDSLACTEQLNAWLPPTMRSVLLKRVCEMYFTFPEGRLIKISKSLDADDGCDTSRHTPDRKSNVVHVKPDTIKSFYESLLQLEPKTMVLSNVNEGCGAFTPPAVTDELPKLMSTFFEEDAVGLPYEDLIVKCRARIQDVCVSNDGLKKVEEITKGQSSTDLWFKFRQGRITASNMQSVCRGDIKNPARSTVNRICYEQPKFQSTYCDRSKRDEKIALKKYTEIQKEQHNNLKVKECGLFLMKDHPFIAASPDGVVNCECCEGSGSVEIKCPEVKNMQKSFDAFTDRRHQYFYQVQREMFVCDFSYCDVFVFHRKEKCLLQRVFPDKESHREILQKSQDYFMYVILPELIAKHFSLSRPPLAPKNIDGSGHTINVCYCQTPRRDPMVLCAGQYCTFSEFHCRCVNLAAAPKKK